jgi:hypothetical protein
VVIQLESGPICKQKSVIHDVNLGGIVVVIRKVESFTLHVFAGSIGTE